ncbi:hypothetical protein [Microcoleus sp. CAWBG58]|uniref:hypothetical protein n=1 Tax=Microcoleus sp. CAWBG58 TaxID=2841651 RepID=UPI0025E276F2|nr:hypothetical protein [Microcoleus sp. CAWBG58]
MTIGNQELGIGYWLLVICYSLLVIDDRDFFYGEAVKIKNLAIQRYKYSTIALKIKERSQSPSHQGATAIPSFPDRYTVLID